MKKPRITKREKQAREQAESFKTLKDLEDRPFLHRVASFSIQELGYYTFRDIIDDREIKTFVTKEIKA